MGKISDAIERHQKETFTGQPIPRPPAPEPRPPAAPERKTEASTVRVDHFNPKLVVISAPGSVDAERFKALRRQIIFSKRDPQPRVIMVTSALPGEGKTYVTANVGCSIAQGVDQHVLLMDCDLRQPSLHNMLGIPNREGLHEYLTGKRKLTDLLIRTSIDRLSLLTAGSVSPNPSELLSSKFMKECLHELRERYHDRYIIIDTTPTQLTSESSALVNYVDGIVLVVRAHKTPREAVQKCVDQVGRDKMLGMVFNDYAAEQDTYLKYKSGYFK